MTVPCHGFFDTGHTWASDAVKVALLTSEASPDPATDFLWTDLSANEVSGTGYTAGGVTLGSKTTTWDATNLRWKFDAADATWTNMEVTDIKFAAVYWTGSGKLLGVFHFAEPVTINATNLTIQFNPNGVWVAEAR